MALTSSPDPIHDPSCQVLVLTPSPISNKKDASGDGAVQHATGVELHERAESLVRLLVRAYSYLALALRHELDLAPELLVVPLEHGEVLHHLLLHVSVGAIHILQLQSQLRERRRSIRKDETIKKPFQTTI